MATQCTVKNEQITIFLLRTLVAENVAIKHIPIYLAHIFLIYKNIRFVQNRKNTAHRTFSV
jgi:hypothetical protein